MRAVLLLVVIFLLMAAAGWVTWNIKGNTASVTVDSAKIQQDSEAMLAHGKQAAERAESRLHESLHPPSSQP